MIASPAYADWEEIFKDAAGNTYHINFDSIRTNGGYVYWWDLSDFLKPNEYGTLSTIVYAQGDCEVFRLKNLSYSYYKQPMGEGRPYMTDSTPDTEWTYPPPNSPAADVFNIVCKLAENL